MIIALVWSEDLNTGVLEGIHKLLENFIYDLWACLNILGLFVVLQHLDFLHKDSFCTVVVTDWLDLCT